MHGRGGKLVAQGRGEFGLLEVAGTGANDK